MDEDRLQFWSLYLARFAEGFGFVTLITLLPYYINALEPTDTTVLGLTISAGLIVGLYTTGFTFAQTLAVVPVAAGVQPFDRLAAVRSADGYLWQNSNFIISNGSR